MRLHDDWRWIVRKAWSIRFMAIAIITSGIEAVLPYFSDAIPRGVFAILTMVFAGGGFAARIIAQKREGVSNGN